MSNSQSDPTNQYAIERQSKIDELEKLLVNLSYATLLEIKNDLDALPESGPRRLWCEAVNESIALIVPSAEDKERDELVIEGDAKVLGDLHLNDEPAPAADLTYIEQAYTENTGGHIMVDVLVLRDSGKVIAVTDDAVAVYPSLEAWQAGQDSDTMIDLNLNQVVS